ncbi:hypothetical protein KFL_001560025 [Klebsormidium nitens]|uniref:Uncharacterized protein n=1 Tax=Klebsormidium nitens TaxID=105231 RepID=A0A1Y1HZM0_KLENI|nr:hypothetical protein KFL_001560025 [Klebsormidium nitens]|eukprot:GAQ83633.1 hypothetical protein KFL_001560025 [Klebsormidium nitens]
MVERFIAASNRLRWTSFLASTTSPLWNNRLCRRPCEALSSRPSLRPALSALRLLLSGGRNGAQSSRHLHSVLIMRQVRRPRQHHGLKVRGRGKPRKRPVPKEKEEDGKRNGGESEAARPPDGRREGDATSLLLSSHGGAAVSWAHKALPAEI